MAQIDTSVWKLLPILPGNMIKRHYSYVKQVLDCQDGYYRIAFTGIIRLNSTTPLVQSNPIPVGFISGNEDGIPSLRPRQAIDPDKPFLIPKGFTIDHYSFRFPDQRTEGNFPYFLSAKDKINGTSGEILKIGLSTFPSGSGDIKATSGDLYTVPNNGIIVPNSFGTKSRPRGKQDDSSDQNGVWVTTDVDTYVYIFVNSGGSLGNGIILSSGAKDALCSIEIIGTYDAEPSTIQQIGLPADPDTY